MRKLRSALRGLAARSGLLGAALAVRSAHPIILMYHGVSADERFDGLRNASELHLPRRTFIEQIRLLRRHRRVIGVAEMAAGLRDGEDLRNTVALTFDDGYENNVLQAAPILADAGMPASFFLATAYIGTNRWIWTDRIEHAFDRTSQSSLEWRGTRLPLETLAQRREALRAVKSDMKRLAVGARDSELAALGDALGAPTELPAGDYRFMDWSQARRLADAGFEVGAHTVNHAILSRLSEQDARTEVLASRDAVIAGTGRCCPVFCYPNGKPEDYSPAVADICRQHFIAALATRRGAARPDELFELSRLSAWGGREALAWTLLRER
jgi:peptidoglycan/xylan/chitin deacetylase (PgdA/CDA1 family)